jgi:hypothetical protein
VPKKPSKKSPDSLALLFVGNSFTARNDVPGLVARIAESRGRRLTHALVSQGGASLRTHWNKGDAARLLAESRFDYLVLQEQSTLPAKNPTRFHENVRLFHAAAVEAGVQTALYMTWARQHEPQNQHAISDAYSAIAAEVGATLVPVGLAWERFLASHDAPVLHDRDGSHPSLAGSFLAACVFYRTLFGDELGDVSVDGLTGSETALLIESSRHAG